MKKTRLDGLKLEDEALKKVSGGGLRVESVNYCVYCKNPHMMTRYLCSSIKVGNMIYTNCDRYVCDLLHFYFYVVIDENGVEHCFDQYLVDRTDEYFR